MQTAEKKVWAHRSYLAVMWRQSFRPAEHDLDLVALLVKSDVVQDRVLALGV